MEHSAGRSLPPGSWLTIWTRTGGEEVVSFPPPIGRQGASELCTGTIGARRAGTVSMISALSMPCR